jgi:hypothetical protein
MLDWPLLSPMRSPQLLLLERLSWAPLMSFDWRTACDPARRGIPVRRLKPYDAKVITAVLLVTPNGREILDEVPHPHRVPMETSGEVPSPDV